MKRAQGGAAPLVTIYRAHASADSKILFKVLRMWKNCQAVDYTN